MQFIFATVPNQVANNLAMHIDVFQIILRLLVTISGFYTDVLVRRRSRSFSMTQKQRL